GRSGAAGGEALPIEPLLPAGVDALTRGGRLVLRAAPGAGKTTRVPAALLDAGSAGTGSVLVLEPRRIAARAAAAFVARSRGGAGGGGGGVAGRVEQGGGRGAPLRFLAPGAVGARPAPDPVLGGGGGGLLHEVHA